jgi:hypothetical protein
MLSFFPTGNICLVRPDGGSEKLVRDATENPRTLRFTDPGFKTQINVLACPSGRLWPHFLLANCQVLP